MKILRIVFTSNVVLATLLLAAAPGVCSEQTLEQAEISWMKNETRKLEDQLAQRYGEKERPRLRRGLKQVAQFWQHEDGDAEALERFVETYFAGDARVRDAMFDRFEKLLEQLDGHMHEISLQFRAQTDLDTGKVYPFDNVFAAYNPSAHVNDDFFRNKLAFMVLLNFPLTTLEERLTEGRKWSRREWAEARLAQRFSKRVPAEVSQAISEAFAEADRYISDYNIWMHHVLGPNGERLFPAGMKLLCHWNLRDEIRADYADRDSGLEKQRIIQKVMERIITQEIPEVVINNSRVDWNPFTNEVTLADERGSNTTVGEEEHPEATPEPDTRYAMLLKTFHAARKMDPYSPTAPTLIERRFNEDREIPEARVREMFERVLTSPLVEKVAAIIESRLDRPLEPFDIWYSGFRPRSRYSETELDSIVRSRYPSAEAYERDIPNMLVKLGFPDQEARYIAERIVVDPARGSGHASGAGMRSAKAHLRTRVGRDGMDYKGYNIAVHEMGHNVEQVLSLCRIDHTLLHGVPNTAFTEALAFVFQGRDLELLGLSKPDEATEAMKTLADFWSTYEIMGVALVDMDVWHWMYEHPDATPEELKQATISISKEIWNRYYAPVFKKRDVILLGIYSHMIDSFLYLPDYPIGSLIAVQIEEQMRKAGSIGPEFERMAVMGRLAPDLWMENATGSPVGAEALLEATERALRNPGRE